MKRTIGSFAVGLGFFAAFVLFATPAHAAYDSNNIIDDGRFANYTTMDEAAIQAFMNARNSGLKNYVDPSVNQSAAKIIRDAAWDFGINPQVIMATLQKEQSLMTNPSPSASNINFAMGYGCPTTGSCSFPGFYQQIRNGSWQLRFNMHRAGGNNGTWTGPTGQTWGNSSISYACRNATAYYSTGLFPGRNVTFYAHTNGQAYANVAIANAATAAMYCYTPHVYNPSGSPVYYSGSYNFVSFYERWFGPTKGDPYAWAYAGQSASAAGGSMLSTQKYTWTVYARNTGTETWTNTGPNPVRLGTSNGRDRTSQFCDTTWIGCNRPVAMLESSVEPGQTATFLFTVQAPVSGQYREYFNLLVEGKTWMNDPGLYFETVVSSPALSGTILGNSTPSAMTANTTGSGTISIRNDGNVTWYNSGRFPMRLGTSNPLDRSSQFYTSGWLGAARVAVMNEASVAPGQTATFTVPLKAPAINGVYSENFSQVIDGYSWFSQQIVKTITVSGGQAAPANTRAAGQALNAGESIRSSDGRYTFILQSDGNLVLYSPQRPLWSSGTFGKPISRAVMQSDGNFVLYDAQGRFYWATWTFGNSGSSIVVQNDGNVVLHNTSGRPIWDTKTYGRI